LLENDVPQESLSSTDVTGQFDFFGSSDPVTPARRTPTLPEGFRYQPELISRDEETALLENVRALPFREFEFHGFTGKRRVVSFGWKYDFGARELQKVDDMPAFLRSLRVHAAAFADLEPESFQHVLVTEYSAGAAIGWHRDKDVFEEIVGISLRAPCIFRLRRQVAAGGWERVNIVAEARSAYLMSGPAREEWEHSIPPVEELRYSITYRNLRRVAGEKSL
jgi:alkylated DNA repair dioxygenase AlkB